MEFRDQQAIYLQIADYICENILLERWKEADRIPSVRELAVSIEVNPNTIMRTYSYLQDKGIIMNKRGIGYFVAENGYESTLQFKKENFIKNEVPIFFKTIDLIRLSFDDLKILYQKCKRSNED